MDSFRGSEKHFGHQVCSKMRELLREYIDFDLKKLLLVALITVDLEKF